MGLVKVGSEFNGFFPLFYRGFKIGGGITLCILYLKTPEGVYLCKAGPGQCIIRIDPAEVYVVKEMLGAAVERCISYASSRTFQPSASAKAKTGSLRSP